MKVQGPGTESIPEAGEGLEKTSDASPRAGSASTESSSGQIFENTLEKTETSSGELGPESATASPNADSIGALAQSLDTGAISPHQAVEAVIQKIIDSRLGPSAPQSVRSELAERLKEALADDPILASQVRRLG